MARGGESVVGTWLLNETLTVYSGWNNSLPAKINYYNDTSGTLRNITFTYIGSGDYNYAMRNEFQLLGITTEKELCPLYRPGMLGTVISFEITAETGNEVFNSWLRTNAVKQ